MVAVTQMVSQLTALAKLAIVDTRINLARRGCKPRPAWCVCLPTCGRVNVRFKNLTLFMEKYEHKT